MQLKGCINLFPKFIYYPLLFFFMFTISGMSHQLKQNYWTFFKIFS